MASFCLTVQALSVRGIMSIAAKNATNAPRDAVKNIPQAAATTSMR